MLIGTRIHDLTRIVGGCASCEVGLRQRLAKSSNMTRFVTQLAY